MSAYRDHSVIRASFGYDLEDARRAHAHARSARKLWRPLTIMGAILASVTGALCITIPVGAYPAALVSMVALGALLLWKLFGGQTAAARRFREFLANRGTTELELSEERFVVRDAFGATSLAWDAVVHWRETDADFYVFRDPHSFHALPKRVFGSAEAVTGVRQLLAERVPVGGEERIDAAYAGAWRIAAIYVAVLALVVASIVEAFAR